MANGISGIIGVSPALKLPCREAADVNVELVEPLDCPRHRSNLSRGRASTLMISRRWRRLVVTRVGRSPRNLGAHSILQDDVADAKLEREDELFGLGALVGRFRAMRRF
jgi:hypothetical protein